MLFLKTFKDAKFVVDGNVFQVETVMRWWLRQALDVSKQSLAVCKLLRFALPLQELACHVWSHSVTCHSAEVTFSPLAQRSWYSIYWPCRGARLSWPYVYVFVSRSIDWRPLYSWPQQNWISCLSVSHNVSRIRVLFICVASKHFNNYYTRLMAFFPGEPG